MQKNKATISFPIIVSAIDGNVDAIHAVLKQYEGYIARLSMRKLYDDDGRSYMVVDEELRRRLETKLITRILKFKIV